MENKFIKDFEKFNSNKKQQNNEQFNIIYNYKYFLLEGDSLVPNEDINKTFGTSREGFEKFRKEYEELNIDVSGKLSLRTIYDYNNDCIGYVLETKVDNRQELITNIKKEYEELLSSFVESFKIKDFDSFNYFLEESGINFHDVFHTSELKMYLNKINHLKELYDRYNEDEDFKKYFDKIIY